LLADVRRGEYEGLAGRADDPAHRPDIGDVARHEKGGAVAIGARIPLVAFNVELGSDDVGLARRIAHAVRERDGGLQSLRALGISLGPGRVQVSMNITDFERVPLAMVTRLIADLARPAGVAVTGCELIGLVPRAALRAAIGANFRLEGA
jgi:glutamate formiminotransferase